MADDGYGPGGFFGDPRLTGPAGGDPWGMSLGSAPPNVAGTSEAIGGFDPRTNSAALRQPIPTNRALVPSNGGGLFGRLRGWLPSILGGNPAAAIGVGTPAALAAHRYKYPEPGRETLSVEPRIDAASSGGIHVGQRLGPSQPDSTTPFQQPAHPSTMRYPMWPTPPAPTGAGIDATIPPFTARGQPSRPVTPTPATAYPASPVAMPAAAGPAAARQQPNLGNYNPFTTVDRPNASATGWNPGAPQATALDLSRLFGGGQPAAAAPRAVGGGAPTAANPNNPYWGPNTAGRAVGGGPIMPTDITGFPVAGVNVPAAASGFTVNPDLSTRRPRPRSSSSSQGGGY